MNKNIIIINYNTQKFVDKLIMSINKHVDNAYITIFDNSDKESFNNKFDNVTVIDNTDGSIINFELFLDQYKNKNFSSGKNNNWASAKHCYTIEKCIEMFNEGFVLMDSDIILKRDITDLFDNDCIYVGEDITQGNGIKRVAPYLCFIDPKKCKENGVHYFDDNYMHGLNKSIQSDAYDTGACFYLYANKHKHRNIKCSEYMVHYGHGSWNINNSMSHITPIEFFNENKIYWE